MTAIAIWCNHENAENPGLWVAADTRVSTPSGSLIDDAAKVFALPVVCRLPGPNGLPEERYHDHTYGYCFAGDTLLGQNAYLALTPLLSNLFSSAKYIPSLDDVARYIHSYLSLTFDACKVHRGERSIFEVALFGYCPKTKCLSAYHFFIPEFEQEVVKMTVESHKNMQKNDFLYLGVEKSRIVSQIRTALNADSSPMAEFNARRARRPLSRAPRYVIQDLINDESVPSIGGDLQLGIADKFGFRAFPLCKPGTSGLAIIRYLGRELTDDLQYVGQALVGGEAVA